MNEIVKYGDMISEIKEILQSARLNVARQVNTELLTAYWNIGRIILSWSMSRTVRNAPSTGSRR